AASTFLGRLRQQTGQFYSRRRLDSRTAGCRARIGGMRRGQDRTGRSWLGLLGVSSFALLTGGGWVGGGAPPVWRLFGEGPPRGSPKLRPGADRQIQANSALPSANPGQQYEQGISAADETRGQGPQIGSIVADNGRQDA